MVSQVECLEKVEALRDEIRGMKDIDDPDVINETATRLKGLNYTPPVPLALKTFLCFTTADLLAEIDRVVAMPESEMEHLGTTDAFDPWAIRLEQISVLVFYFKELAELRRQAPEAWDEVDELYVHD